MPSFIVEGRNPLKGKIQINGSKNATLPILTACLLTDEECTLTNVPDIPMFVKCLQFWESLARNTNLKITKLRYERKNSKRQNSHMKELEK